MEIKLMVCFLSIHPTCSAAGLRGNIRYIGASLTVQLVKNLPAMQETLVQFLGQEDPLEKEQATHCSILGVPLWLSW